MGKPFDSTTKVLLERGPADWLRLANWVTYGPARLIHAGLETITAEADDVIQVDEAFPWLAHVELQASRDLALPARLLRYNVLLAHRHNLPTRSLAVLLRPQADGPELSGTFQRGVRGEPGFLEFVYQVVRVWELPVDSLLTGGLATLPLAMIADLRPESAPDVVRRIDARLQREAPSDVAATIWTATSILMGLRYPEPVIATLLRGVRNMRESVTYQAILREGADIGREEGRLEGRHEGSLSEARNFLLRIGRKRLGEPNRLTLETIERIANLDQLERIGERVTESHSWSEALGLEAP